MFYAYYRTDTGQLLSVATQYRSDADLNTLSFEKGYPIALKAYSTRPTNSWDPVTKDFTIPQPAPLTHFSNLFLRMSLDEHAQIILLTKQNTIKGAKAAAWMERMRHLESLNKDNNELVLGMTLLVQEGIFTAERAEEILGWD